MKKREDLQKFTNNLTPEMKRVIGKIIKAEGEGQHRIKIRIRQIVAEEVQRRET